MTEYRHLSFLADVRLWLACAALALAGCGGGGGGGAAAATETPMGGTDPVVANLAVSAGTGGWVSVVVDTDPPKIVAAGESADFGALAVADTLTLTASTATGYTFSGWTLTPSDLSCAEGLDSATCTLSAGSVTAAATAAAAFETISRILTVIAGTSGSVSVELNGAAAGTVVASMLTTLTVTVEDTLTLTAVPAAGHTFASWTLTPSDLSCDEGGTGSIACTLPAGSITADTTAAAAFVALATGEITLAVSAGTSGSVSVVVGAVDSVTVDAGASMNFPSTSTVTVTLTATPTDTNYEFIRWTLSNGLRCSEGPFSATCTLAANSFPVGTLTVEASFAIITRTLAVAAGTGGSVSVMVGAVGAVTVDAGASMNFDVTVENEVTLTASTATGYTFSGWTLTPSDLSCDEDLDSVTCTLIVRSVTNANGGTAAAAFAAVPRTLAVSAGANGSVSVELNGADVGSVAADASSDVTATVEDAVILTATADDGFRFDGWTFVPTLSCDEDDTGSITCTLPAGSITGDASAAAAFSLVAVSWTGPGMVNLVGNIATAVEYAPGTFIGWTAGPCAGTTALTCDVSEANAVASFRPFTVAGIKELAFGLGYNLDPQPDYYKVSGGTGMSTGFPVVPGLERIVPAQGQTSTTLALSLHALRWDGSQSYLTEECAADDSCKTAPGGQDMLEREQLLGAIGYFKAPNARADDRFGLSVALSADGGTLAVGADEEDSSATGAFHPGDAGYAAALASRGASSAGAAYVYRRSSGQWNVEAYVKAPNAGASDRFGSSVALSADGGTLAVGAPIEDSSATGAFHPGDAGYAAALASNGASNAGAAYVYRRSSGQWNVEAFVKAPNAEADDRFVISVALSADGATLAVGAPTEDSSATGAFHPGDGGYAAALASGGASGAGAAYVYRRSSETETWSVEAFVKAPNAEAGDVFGLNVVLSGDGDTLAVGAPVEDSDATGAFHPGDGGYAAALASSAASSAGAAYVYRRSSETETWSVEAYIKAPNSRAGALFGGSLFGASVVALSADGDVLAVGVPDEPSNATSTFHPSDIGYGPALASSGAAAAGAAYVYRRSSGQWNVEAFVKAPNAEAGDRFGNGIALSGGGDTLAVGAPAEDSGATGAFHPGDAGYAAALVGPFSAFAGAAYVYRRSSGQWNVGAYVKAPNAAANGQFGIAVALSADDTLAVSADGETRGGLPRPQAWDATTTAGNMGASVGAVYLY